MDIGKIYRSTYLGAGVDIHLFRVFGIKSKILGFSPFQAFIRYSQNKNGLSITGHISNTTKNFRRI